MYETWLIPYLEGTLDAERRRELEARLADDPRLASELGALRRAEPRLRAGAAGLRRIEEGRPAPAPLWPGLRGRLDARPARHRIGPALWWTGGGLCAAGLLVLAVLRGPVLRPEVPDRRAAWEARHAPVIVSHADDGAGGPVVERLRARDRRVGAAERAAGGPALTRVAGRPALAAASAAPAPAAAVSVPAAPPVPMRPPLRVARREPDTLLPFPVGLPPAPTHSPPPPGAAPALPPAPTHSPAPAQAEKARAEPTVSAPVFDSARANEEAGAAPAAAPPETAGVEAARPARPRTLNGGVSAAPPAAATLRQRLERALTPPVYGTDVGEAQEQKLLRTVHEGGVGDALRASLSSEDGADAPAATARLLAVLDEDGGDWAGAAAHWRRLALGPDAVAEDWYRLARAEAHLGHADAARQADARALQPGPFPLSAAHRATALQNAPQVSAPGL